ncbi:MAG: kelch repeat-containing protein [Thermoplasmata archaeon]
MNGREKKSKIVAGVAVALMCLLALSVLSPTVEAASASWTMYPFSMGEGRTQALVAQDENGIVYIMAGYNAVPMSVDGKCYAYNPATGSWKSLAPSTWYVRGSSGGFANDGRLYMISGFRDLLPGPWYATQIYNVTTDSWSLGANIPIPVWEAKSFNTGDHFYVVGGESTAHPYETANQIYNVTTNTWWTGAPLPVGLTSGATVTVGGYGYYFGGFSNGHAVDTVYRYDIASDSWTQMASMPAPLCAHTAIVGQDGLVYVFGGANYALNQPPTTYGDVYVYNIATDSWTTIDDLNVPRAWLGSALFDNKILAIGGNDDTTVFSSVEAFDTLPSQIAILQDQLTSLQGQLAAANNDISNLEDDISDLTDENAALRQKILDLSALLNQTNEELENAINDANNNADNAKAAADSANLMALLGMVIGVIAILIAIVSILVRPKKTTPVLMPQPPGPPSS